MAMSSIEIARDPEAQPTQLRRRFRITIIEPFRLFRKRAL